MPNLPDTSESLLVRLACPDDVAAWDQFVRIYGGAVSNYCRNRGLQEADVQEIVQEVLLLVYRRIPDWKPSGRSGSFRVWLLRTAHRMCLKSIRERAGFDRGVGGTSVQISMQSHPQQSDHAELPEPILDWQRWAFQWAARQVQDEIKPATWQAFWLSAVECLPVTEVAERLSMRVGSIYTNKCRVLARIRDRVQELSRNDI